MPPILAHSGYQWQHLIDMALNHRREIIIAQLIAIATALLSVPIPLLVPLLVDEVLLNQPGPLIDLVHFLFPEQWQGPVLVILFFTALTLFLRFLTLILGVLQNREFTKIAKHIIYRLRKQLIQRLQTVSMSEYEVVGSGQVNSHLITDLDTLDQFIGSSISRLLVAFLTLLGIAIVLLWMHWQLALIILLINPIVIYTTTLLGETVKVLKRKENEAYANFQQRLTETLEAIQQIRAYNREQFYLNQVITDAKRIKDHTIAYAWKSDATNRLSFNIFLLGSELFRAISMLMVLFSDLSIGQMLAVTSYLWFMMGPIQELITIQYQYHGAKAALKRINTLFTLSPEPTYPHHQNPFLEHPTASIRLENICFSYNQQDWVLNNISLTIAPGEKVALVGASGGGKTTLVQILLGLYAPQAGKIYFNDIPITEIGMDVVREHVVTVLQHPALFNDTLRMNLTLGRDLTDEQLWHALDIAQLTTTVQQMPDRLDTLLGQRGIRLSGGQRQRVAVARMILANPKIVILDEATSALDTETEGHLHHALQTFLKDKTTLIIAHRLSAVKQADRVLVFDQGHIIEQGSHTQLIQENGLYAKLYANQTPINSIPQVT